jgi:hypothetical protein
MIYTTEIASIFKSSKESNMPIVELEVDNIEIFNNIICPFIKNFETHYNVWGIKYLLTVNSFNAVYLIFRRKLLKTLGLNIPRGTHHMFYISLDPPFIYFATDDSRYCIDLKDNNVLLEELLLTYFV